MDDSFSFDLECTPAPSPRFRVFHSPLPWDGEDFEIPAILEGVRYPVVRVIGGSLGGIETQVPFGSLDLLPDEFVHERYEAPVEIGEPSLEENAEGVISGSYPVKIGEVTRISSTYRQDPEFSSVRRSVPSVLYRHIPSLDSSSPAPAGSNSEGAL